MHGGSSSNSNNRKKTEKQKKKQKKKKDTSKNNNSNDNETRIQTMGNMIRTRTTSQVSVLGFAVASTECQIFIHTGLSCRG